MVSLVEHLLLAVTGYLLPGRKPRHVFLFCVLPHGRDCLSFFEPQCLVVSNTEGLLWFLCLFNAESMTLSSKCLLSLLGTRYLKFFKLIGFMFLRAVPSLQKIGRKYRVPIYSLPSQFPFYCNGMVHFLQLVNQC